MRKKNQNKIVYSIILFIFCLGYGIAQNGFKKYPFVKENLNFIHNAEELNSFFSVLKESGKEQVSVLHIGDSHLQANLITDILRKGFQKKFGNAGRGLVVPYKVAGTNSPGDIVSTSDSGKWEGKRNCKPLLPQATGIGGITIESTDSTSAFSVTLPGKEYEFTKMTVFFQNDETSYDLQVVNLTDMQVFDLKEFSKDKNKNVADIKFASPTTRVQFLSKKTSPEQTHTTIFGINTENDQKGLVYHSIGVNGAEYFHYDTSEYFNEETPFLNPDVIIISLGTNEAYRKDADFDPEKIKEEINSLVANLKKYNPGVPFLITTPAYAYKNKVQNPRLKTIRDILVSYCEENKLAYWDLQTITGSASNWKTYNLFSKDLVHFNKDGYQLQGNLLLNALLNAYNQYVTNH